MTEIYWDEGEKGVKCVMCLGQKVHWVGRKKASVLLLLPSPLRALLLLLLVMLSITLRSLCDTYLTGME